MPTYCYSTLEGGPVFERRFSIHDDIPETISVAGVTLKRDYAAERPGGRSGDPWTEHWSLSMGAPTLQAAKETAARCKAAGVECHYNDHLMLQVKSRKHQQQLRKVILGPGARNHDESYSS